MINQEQPESPQLDWAAVCGALRTIHVGRDRASFVYLAHSPSTNTHARGLVRDGAASGTVVFADDQTAGRGRLGRVWSVPPRTGLTFSTILRPATGTHGQGSSAVPSSLVMAAALAVYDLTRDDLHLTPTLKWPNDVLLGGRKVSGILVEAADAPSRPGEGGASAAIQEPGSALLIAGIGLNVNATPPGLGGQATCLATAHGSPLRREDVLVALLQHLDSAYEELVRRPARVWQRWRAALSTIGQIVDVHLPGGTVVRGRAEDVAPSGALLVRDSAGRLHTLHAGDVTLGGPYGPVE